MAVNKVMYGNRTVMDITDTTATPDTILMGYQGYSASGDKIQGKVGVTVENGIMVCNGPLFNVSSGMIEFKVKVDNNNILEIG